MKPDKELDTITEVISELRLKNYVNDFTIENDMLVCRETGEGFTPGELIIDNTFRFEGDSNPDDMSVIYAITAKSGTKGIVIDAYGTYSNSQISAFIKDVPVREEHDFQDK